MYKLIKYKNYKLINKILARLGFSRINGLQVSHRFSPFDRDYSSNEEFSPLERELEKLRKLENLRTSKLSIPAATADKQRA